MKKLTAVVLTLALALALAGCGAERTAYVEAQRAKAEGCDAARARLADSGCSEGFISMLTADELERLIAADELWLTRQCYRLDGERVETVSAQDYDALPEGTPRAELTQVTAR